MDGLSDIGACRLCLVEIKGQNKLLPACVTVVEEGMEVTTDSERLQNYRRMILELFFTERNHVCSVCVSNGHCEMQMLAQRLGITHVHFPYRYPKEEVDASHDRFVIDHNRCILCTRCVRVCDEIEGAHTWDVMGRGIDAKVITDLNEPWGSSETCTTLRQVRACMSDGSAVRKRKLGRGDAETPPVPAVLDHDAEGERMTHKENERHHQGEGVT